MALDDRQNSTVIAANGTGEITFAPGRGQTWTVQQATTDADGIGGTALCNLYRSGVFVAAIFPTKGVAEGLPYVVVRPNQKFTARWTGGAPGVTATFAIIFDDGT
jgi:hypothetical protein